MVKENKLLLVNKTRCTIVEINIKNLQSVFWLLRDFSSIFHFLTGLLCLKFTAYSSTYNNVCIQHFYNFINFYLCLAVTWSLSTSKSLKLLGTVDEIKAKKQTLNYESKRWTANYWRENSCFLTLIVLRFACPLSLEERMFKAF